MCMGGRPKDSTVGVDYHSLYHWELLRNHTKCINLWRKLGGSAFRHWRHYFILQTPGQRHSPHPMLNYHLQGALIRHLLLVPLEACLYM